MATRPEKVVIGSESFKRFCTNGGVKSGCVKSDGSKTTVHGLGRLHHRSYRSNQFDLNSLRGPSGIPEKEKKEPASSTP